jgi:hypothetical protein
MMHEGDSAIVTHGSNAELELGRIPDIVLVTEGDCLSRTAPQRAYEIVGETQALMMAHDLDGKGRAGGKGLHHGEGAVGRMIVTDNQLALCVASATDTFIEFVWKSARAVLRRRFRM